MAERVQGGTLAARAIAAAGVDCVFTLSGGHVMPIYEGSRHEGVRIVDVRHEQSAAHAAEAWGRVRRACGVALVTAGPGVTGTVTAVANCFAAQTPLVVLGGARPLAQSEWGALQEFDQLSLMKPITKWAAVCPATERIPEYVAIAFRHALAAPRGPVYLELPADILFADGDADVVTAAAGARAFPDPRELVTAAELLSSAERPAVVAGSGVWWDGAAAELARLAEHGRLPVYLNGSGRGSLPPDHDLFFQHSRGVALDEADLVCVVGTPLDFRLRYGRFGKGKLIHVHGDPRELGRNRVPDAALVGDCAAVLGALADGVERPAGDRTTWLDRLRAASRSGGTRTAPRSSPTPRRSTTTASAPSSTGCSTRTRSWSATAAMSWRRCRACCASTGPATGSIRGRSAVSASGPATRSACGAAGFGKRVVCVMGDGALRAERARLRHARPLRDPGRARGGQRRRVGRDPRPAGRDVRRRTPRSRPASRRAATTGSARCSAATRSTSSARQELAPALERALASGDPAIVNVMLDPDAMAGHAYRGF